MRDPEELLSCAHDVIDYAFEVSGLCVIAPLFSGGHDSLCACYAASLHKRFRGFVHHIDTGIGSLSTKRFVRMCCRLYKWRLCVYKEPTWTYERIVSTYGFPGPGRHHVCYQSLKRSCVDYMTRHRGGKYQVRYNWLLVNGARQQESARRMGNTEPVRFGDRGYKDRRSHQVWVSPCWDWSSDEQRSFMDYFALERNPVKDSIIGMSGECFCGAFARPNELDMIREICPDVAAEIDRLSLIAKAKGKHCVWGTTPDKSNGSIISAGPLCSACDSRAEQLGIIFRE